MPTAESISDARATVFIARQPIFDRRKRVFAYELHYRSDLAPPEYAGDEYATSNVIANLLLIGLKKLADGKKVFINFNRKFLLGQIPLLFPHDILGVEIPESVQPDSYIIKVCSRIKKSGYLMILDNVLMEEEYRPIISMADIVKVNFHTSTPEQRRTVFEKAGSRKIKFLAANIDTRKDYREARKLGYRYFQGFFFQEPAIFSRQELPGYKLNYLKALKKIYDPFLDINSIEEIIKRDISLTYKLLRFINSAAYGFKVKIRSIRHALNLLGKREIKRWLTIIVMSGMGREKPLELMNIAIIRGRFCELIAAAFKLKTPPPDLFLIGMLSLVNAFLDRPIADILSELPLDEHIKAALQGEQSQAHDVLQMVIAYEKASWETFRRLAKKLELKEEKLTALYLDAVQWSNVFAKENEETKKSKQKKPKSELPGTCA